jgi:hypothetical protein
MLQRKNLREDHIETYFRRRNYERTALKHISEEGIMGEPH